MVSCLGQCLALVQGQFPLELPRPTQMSTVCEGLYMHTSKRNVDNREIKKIIEYQCMLLTKARLNMQ